MTGRARYTGMKMVYKILIFVGLYCVAASFSIPQNAANDLQKLNLNGNIRSMMETRYAVDSEADTIVKDTIISQKLIYFTKNGYESTTTVYRNGEEFTRSQCRFGDNEKQTILNEFRAGAIYLKIKYYYDDEDFRTEAHYDWIEQRQYVENKEKVNFGYDVFNKNFFTKVLYSYNRDGLCKEEKYLKSDGSLAFMHTYRYDFRGNKTEMEYYNSNGKPSWRTTYKYDRYHNLIERKLFKDHRLATKSVYKYQFDEGGNWISCVEDRELQENILTAHLDSASVVTERKIEYY